MNLPKWLYIWKNTWTCQGGLQTQAWTCQKGYQMPTNKNAIKATYIDRTHNKIHSEHQTCQLELKVMETMFFFCFQNKKFCLITAPIRIIFLFWLAHHRWTWRKNMDLPYRPPILPIDKQQKTFDISKYKLDNRFVFPSCCTWKLFLRYTSLLASFWFVVRQSIP